MPPASQSVRRSVALPKTLVDELARTAPPELKSNLNRLVIVALQQYVKSQERLAFDRAMDQMAADSKVQREIANIEQEFKGTESDGLTQEDW